MSKPRMTPSQAQATNPDLTAFVGASAGTGKTHVLTARVLRLMLTGTPPENILCLTFTKAAASEMTARIFDELGSWTVLSDADLRAEIRRRTEEDADTGMLERARRLFVEVLDLEGGLKIQTFHSFCQSLLGRFPLEAGLTPGFEAVEEAEAADVMQAARDRTLSDTRTARGQHLRAALEEVARRVSETSFADVIRQLSFSQATLEAGLKHYGSDMGLYAALAKALKVDPADTPESVTRTSVEVGQYDEVGLTRLMHAFEHGSKTEKKAWEGLRAFLGAVSAQDRMKALDAYRLVFLRKDGQPKKTVATKKTLESDPSFDAVIAFEQNRLATLAETIARLEAYKATKALLTLGIAQLGAYGALKASRGLVDFDDMIRSARGLLTASGIAPWILFKLDSGLDHILVDEAQDTNAAQWQVIEALCAEFFAGQGAQEGPRTVFAVGDVKQSIFSFQHADPREFEAAEDRLLTHARASGQQAQHIELDRSFRSAEAVLGVVDATFRPESMPVHGLGRLQGTLSHAYTRTHVGGSVSLWPLEVPIEDTTESETWVPPTTPARRLEPDERTALKLARHVSGLVGKDMLKSQGRRVRPGDILVLVRRRGKFVDHLSKALKAEGLAVAGRDRMILTDELVIKDLMALGEWVLQTSDDLSLAAVLRSPLIGLSEDQLFALAHGRTGTLWDSLRIASRSDGKMEDAYEHLSLWLGAADQQPPYDFYADILETQKMRRQLAGRLGSDIHDPVDSFLAEAAAYSRTRTPSLRGFLTSLGRAGKTLKREFDFKADEVRIMTVHSAKGLQAPIVILADTVSLPDITQDARLRPFTPEDGGADLLLWTSPAKNLPMVEDMKAKLKAAQMQEYARLLYVALTRAEDHMIIVGWQGQRGVPDECWYRWVESGLVHLGAKEDDLGRLTYSKPFTGELSPDETEADGEQPIAQPEWVGQHAAVEASPPRPLMPSTPDPEDPPAESPLAILEPTKPSRAGRARGKLIHELLEVLPGLEFSLRAEVMQSYLERSKGELTEEERRDTARQVDAVLSHPEFRELFSPDAQAEVSLSGLVSEYGRPEILAAQVDRILIRGDRVQIVDFKTNRRPPAALEDIDRAYVEQMGLYRTALMSVYPDRSVEAALLWTETATLMPLPGAFLDQAMEKRKARITAS